MDGAKAATIPSAASSAVSGNRFTERCTDSTWRVENKLAVWAKNQRLRLHITERVVEFSVPYKLPCLVTLPNRRYFAMKRFAIVTMLAVSALLMAGCRSGNGGWGSGWPRCSMYRGDECSAAPTYDSMQVMPEGMIMGPTTTMPETLPGPTAAAPST